MNNKEANRIIDNYKPHKGFYDLSERPKTLNKIKYAKVLNTQNILAEAEGNKEHLMKMTPIQYQEAKEISAIYLAIVWQYWGYRYNSNI